jgi:hypothetical protein
VPYAGARLGQINGQAGYLRLVPEQEGAIETGNGDRHQLDRHQQPTDNGIGRRWCEDKMQTQELGRLGGRRFPWGKQQRQDEDGHHAVEHVKIERFRRKNGLRLPRGGAVERCAALGAVAVDFGQFTPAIQAGLHTLPRLHGIGSRLLECLSMERAKSDS